MSKVICEKQELVDIADETRSIIGTSEPMSLEEISNNLESVANECDVQSALIAEIKTALEGKAGGGGGTVLPTLTNPATASDLAEGKQLIDGSGKVVDGDLSVMSDGDFFYTEGFEYNNGARTIFAGYYPYKDMILKSNNEYNFVISITESDFGNATTDDVAAGKIFTSGSGVKLTGTAQMGGGYAIKSGTTTSGTINTGLSDVEQFFMYKETQTGTGLIRLHYTKAATSRMYASAWSTQNYGSKTITNGTGGVTVSGGTVTISATQAAQGALTSGVTYKWFAIGTE